MSDSASQNGRREFLKFTGLGVAGALVASRALRANAAPPAKTAAATPAAGATAAKTEVLKESDPQAVALGYKEDATKVDTKKWPKRATPDGQKQFCWNCQLYQSKSDKPGSVPQAPCTLFANKQVKGKGWCNSWVVNPNAKA
jgi:hypothetical protein